MKKQFLWLIAVLWAPAATLAQAPVNYDVSLIPDSLKTNAHVVVRADDQSLTVYSPSKALHKVHQAFTILDDAGKGRLQFAFISDAFNKLEDADLFLYDAHGALLQHIRQKEMSIDGYDAELVTDGKTTFFQVNAPSYPVTLEIDFTDSYKGMLDYPDFELNNTECAFQEGKYTVTVPKSIGLRYHNRQVSYQPLVSDDGKGNQVYTWKISPTRAIPEEKWTLGGLTPRVMIAPTQFEMDDYPGEMNNWGQFGKWIYDLNKPSYSLPPAAVAFYQQMVSGASTDVDKARILYAYLQKNFRYVDIVLGIGGWRSFPAAVTDKKKYGDCKGLSTYMKACLDAVGVKSYTAVINAGPWEAPVDPAFPTNRFNHMILCIPQPKDSIWLECTSNRTDFGVLGTSTENRYALLLTENGGVLVHTPSSRLEGNQTSFNTFVNLAEDGSGKASVAIRTTGNAKEDALEGLYEETHDNQKKYLVEELDFQQPDDFTVHLNRIDTPVLNADIVMAFEKVPDFIAGSKLFLNPRLYHIWQYRLPPVEGRTKDVYFPYPSVSSDTTCYQLPEGFAVSDLPKGQTLNGPNASYTSSYRYDADKRQVYSYCTLTIKNRRVPASDFASVKRFFSQVTEDETEKIVVGKP